MEGLRKRENLGAQESRFEVDDCGRVIGHFSRQVCAIGDESEVAGRDCESGDA